MIYSGVPFLVYTFVNVRPTERGKSRSVGLRYTHSFSSEGSPTGGGILETRYGTRDPVWTGLYHS